MSDHVGSVRFRAYLKGEEVYVSADRVQTVDPGDLLCHGPSAKIWFTDHMSLTVRGDAESVRKRIDAARSYG